MTRRDLMSFTASLTGASLSLEGQRSSPIDNSTYRFWSEEIRRPEDVRTLQTTTPARASFVFFDAAKSVFVAGSDIGDAELPDRGDLDIIVKVDHIRPSNEDQGRIENLEGGSLRIDLQQTQPLPSLAERLAWTAIAGFLPENRKLPALKEMAFDPGTAWGELKTVPLPKGGGKWTWNFFLQRRKSRWMQALDAIGRNKNLLIPIFGLGLPAIAITALDTVDKIVAEITKDERSEWLFQSRDVYLYATKQARDAFEGTKLRLRQGTYLVVPENQLSALDGEQGKLTVKDGLLVPKGTSSLGVYAAAKQVLPQMTYLTVGVSTTLKPAA